MYKYTKVYKRKYMQIRTKKMPEILSEKVDAQTGASCARGLKAKG